MASLGKITVELQTNKNKNKIEDEDDWEHPIPDGVDSVILIKVIEYLKKHLKPDPDEDRRAWDANFLKVDRNTLSDLFRVALAMNIKSLLVLISEAVHDQVKGKTPEEIRRTFYPEEPEVPECVYFVEKMVRLLK